MMMRTLLISRQSSIGTDLTNLASPSVSVVAASRPFDETTVSTPSLAMILGQLRTLLTSRQRNGVTHPTNGLVAALSMDVDEAVSTLSTHDDDEALLKFWLEEAVAVSTPSIAHDTSSWTLLTSGLRRLMYCSIFFGG